MRADTRDLKVIGKTHADLTALQQELEKRKFRIFYVNRKGWKISTLVKTTTGAAAPSRYVDLDTLQEIFRNPHPWIDKNFLESQRFAPCGWTREHCIGHRLG